MAGGFSNNDIAPIGIRGIRQRIPAGSILGRIQGSGQPQAIDLQTLAQQLAQSGGVPVGGGGGGSGSLAGLSDVDVSGVADGNSLVYSSGSGLWVPGSGGGGGGTGLFSQVMSTTPTKANTGLSLMMGASSPTATDIADGVKVTAPASTGALVYNASALPSTPYSYEILCAAGPEVAIVPFFGFSDGTKCMLGYTPKLGDSGWGAMFVVTENPLGTFVSTLASSGRGCNGALSWMKVRNDGTNVTWSFGTNGVDWSAVYTVSLASSYLGSSGFTRLVFGTNVAGTATILSFKQGT